MPRLADSQSTIDTSLALLEHIQTDVLPRSQQCIGRSHDQLTRASKREVTSTERLLAPVKK